MKKRESLLNSDDYALWILLTQIRNITAKARERLVDQKVYPRTQGAALYFINTKSEGVTIEELAGYLFLSRNSVSELLDRMINKGWVTRVKHLAENHRVKFALTEEGKKACFRATMPELICEMISCLAPNQREHLKSLLGILREKALDIYSRNIPSA
jgi:DNA-binding MarR family transcriptional regulator